MDIHIEQQIQGTTGQTPILLATAGYEGYDIPELLDSGARFVRPVVEKHHAQSLVKNGQLDAYRTGASDTDIKAPVVDRWGLVTGIFDLSPSIKRGRCFFVGPCNLRTTFRFVRALNCEQLFIHPLRGDRQDHRFCRSVKAFFEDQHGDQPEAIAESPTLAVLTRFDRGLLTRLSPDEIDATTRRSYLFNR